MSNIQIGLVTDQAETFSIGIDSAEGGADDQWLRNLAQYLKTHIPSTVPWTGHVTSIQILASIQREVEPT